MDLTYFGVELFKRNKQRQMDFDYFAVDGSNEKAYKTVKKLFKNKTEYSPLYIYGKSGLGKTHLVTAIAKEMENEKNFSLINCEEFINEVNNNEDIEKYYNYDFFIIDDIQYIMLKEKAKNELVKLINYFIKNNKKMILTSTLPPQIIFKDSEDIDLSKGVITEITMPKVRIKREVAKKFEEDEEVVFNNVRLGELINESTTVENFLDKLDEEKFEITFKG